MKIRLVSGLLLCLSLSSALATLPVRSEGQEYKVDTAALHEACVGARQQLAQGRMIKAYIEYNQILLSLEQCQDTTTAFRLFSYRIHGHALALTDSIMQLYSNAVSRMIFSRALSGICEQTVDLAFELYQVRGDRSYFDRAFGLAERTRYLALTETVRTSDTALFTGEAADLYLAWKEALSQMFVLQSMVDMRIQATAMPHPEVDERLYDSSAVLHARADSLLDLIRRSYPRQYALLFGGRTVSTSSILTLAQHTSTALIEFYWGAKNIHTFMIGPEGIQWHRTGNDSTLVALLQSYMQAFFNPDPQAFEPQAASVYQRFMLPLQSGLNDGTSLLIIPDGPLAAIPFECLVKERSAGRPAYNTMDFLIRHHCVHYAPSATLLLEAGWHRQPGEQMKMIAFAPGFSDPMKDVYSKNCGSGCDSLYLGLPEQRWSGRLVEELKGTFDGAFYTETQATLQRFKAESGDYPLIHLASHSMADPGNPMSSRIVFARSAGDTAADAAYLYARDLYRMKINASLAVLGSCATGSGQYSQGEGMLSLAHAFAYAGCPALVYSLWEVDEKETAALFSDFYQGLSAGETPDIALHHAKLKAIDEGGEYRANPYYWAGFVMSGKQTALVRPDSCCNPWIPGGGAAGAALLLALLVFLRKRK